MAEFRLPRLDRNLEITAKGDTPSVSLQRYIQSFAEKIEEQEGLQDGILEAILQAQADIIAVQEELAEQLALIIAAQNTADAVTTANAISASFIVPSTVLTAEDAGADATITIAGFTRYYDDSATPVVVTGSTLTGLAYSTTYTVYYDDATRSDATPNFVATTNGIEGRHNFAVGRHFLETITTPGAGEPGTGGTGSLPPGGGTLEES